MTTSIKDHQLDDHMLFEKVETNRIFRPWDPRWDKDMNETTKAKLKAHLNNLTAINSKSTLSNGLLPNDYLTEMFSTSCTMNQSSLNAMETIYSHFYRDYFASSSTKNLAIKIENGSSSMNNDLSFLNTFSNKMNLSKIVNGNYTTTSNGALSNSSLTNNNLLTNNLITNGLVSNSLSSSSNLPNNLTSPLIERNLNTKLSCISASEATSLNQLPTKTTNDRFLTPLQTDKNQTKKPRPKRFRCPHCDIAFSNNGQLKGHIRTHTGERPFVCDNSTCGKTFTRNEELTRHKRIHTGLRPYDCSVCSKKFGRKDHLKKHQRTHEKRKIALSKNTSNSINNLQLTSSICCLPSSFNSTTFSKNKLSSLNRSLRSEKISSKIETKQQQKKSDNLTLKLNTAGKMIAPKIDQLTNLSTPKQTKQFLNHHNKSIDSQLISSTTNCIPHTNSTLFSSSSFLLQQTSNHHSIPALSSLNTRANLASSNLNSIDPLINQSFSNQFSNQLNNQLNNHSTTSPALSECSFNSNSPIITSSLSTSINSPSLPSLPINTLPFTNPLYFNPLMLTFIQ